MNDIAHAPFSVGFGTGFIRPDNGPLAAAHLGTITGNHGLGFRVQDMAGATLASFPDLTDAEEWATGYAMGKDAACRAVLWVLADAARRMTRAGVTSATLSTATSTKLT